MSNHYIKRHITQLWKLENFIDITVVNISQAIDGVIVVCLHYNKTCLHTNGVSLSLYSMSYMHSSSTYGFMIKHVA